MLVHREIPISKLWRTLSNVHNCMTAPIPNYLKLWVEREQFPRTSRPVRACLHRLYGGSGFRPSSVPDALVTLASSEVEDSPDSTLGKVLTGSPVQISVELGSIEYLLCCTFGTDVFSVSKFPSAKKTRNTR